MIFGDHCADIGLSLMALWNKDAGMLQLQKVRSEPEETVKKQRIWNFEDTEWVVPVD